jgi:hypothetical protein
MAKEMGDDEELAAAIALSLQKAPFQVPPNVFFRIPFELGTKPTVLLNPKADSSQNFFLFETERHICATFGEQKNVRVCFFERGMEEPFPFLLETRTSTR